MKRLLAISLIASLFLSIASLATAVSNKPAPPAIEKITFVHYAKPDDHSKPPWDDTEDNFRLIAGGVKWSDTISYEVNPTGSGLSAGVVRSTLETSSETWNSETSFALFASPTTTTETSIGFDTYNRIVWEALDPGVIAVTILWFNPATKQIVEFDMIFNTYYPWETDGSPDNMDLQNIATHELGHNGLADLYPPKDAALTMYAFSNLGETEKRDLGAGDILGIQKLYRE